MPPFNDVILLGARQEPTREGAICHRFGKCEEPLVEIRIQPVVEGLVAEQCGIDPNTTVLFEQENPQDV